MLLLLAESLFRSPGLPFLSCSNDFAFTFFCSTLFSFASLGLLMLTLSFLGEFILFFCLRLLFFFVLLTQSLLGGVLFLLLFKTLLHTAYFFLSSLHFLVPFRFFFFFFFFFFTTSFLRLDSLRTSSRHFISLSLCLSLFCIPFC
jgi:hypothetical protein